MEESGVEKKRTDRVRRWKVAAGVTLGVLVLLWGGERILNHILIRKICQQTELLTQGAFHLRVDNLAISVSQRGVHLRGVTLVGDSVVLAARNVRIASLRLEIEELSLLHLWIKSKAGELRIGRVVLKNPQLFFSRRPAFDTIQRKELFQHRAANRPERLLKEILIGQLKIRNGTLHYQERKTHLLDRKIEGISLQTDHLHFDLTGADKGRSLLQGDMRASLTGLKYQFKEGAFELQVDTLQVDTRHRYVKMNGVRLQPQFSKQDFALVVGGHPDWLQLQLQNLVASGVDFESFFAHQGLYIDSVGIAGMNLQTFKNRQIQQHAHRKALLWQTLRAMSFELAVRKIGFSDVDVTYQELAPASLVSGTVTFSRLRGKVSGLTNRGSKSRGSFTIDASGWLMHRGWLSAHFTIPILPNNDQFVVNGTLGTMSAQALNPILRPMADLQINTGVIQKMNFRISGDSLASNVRLELYYDQLNLSLMKDAAGGWRKRKLLTAVVDNLVLRHANPSSGELRIGAGTFDRDPYRSQFNYLWKSLLPGIKSTVIGSTSQTEKLDRQERRELREKRRAIRQQRKQATALK